MGKRLFFFLYLSEGAPIGFIWWAMPAILSKYGFKLSSIATISALATIPWTFKFLLAPIIDLISLKLFSLKKQLIVYQILMGFVLILLPSAIRLQNQVFIITVLIIHGIFASAQDICIDSLAIKSIPSDKLGEINGVMQAGMLCGRSLFGGAGVFIASYLGLEFTTYFLLSCVWISIVYLQKTKIKLKQKEEIRPKKYFDDFIKLLKKSTIWKLALITYFSGFSYNGISTIGSAVLSEKGVSPVFHGLTYSLIIPFFMTMGALYGGKFSDRYNSQKFLSWMVICSIISSCLTGSFMDFVQEEKLLIISYAFFYFFIGATTTSLYTFLMQKTSKEFSALEFSIFMSITNLCDSTSSYLTGQLVEELSYFSTAMIIGSICLITLIALRQRIEV